jgi:hypothetical protein
LVAQFNKLRHSRSEMAPHPQTSRATLRVYQLTRVELLCDLYVCAYERTTQEYLAIKQELAEPDPAGLARTDQANHPRSGSTP